MPLSASVRREKLLEAARGYLALDMPTQAIAQLDAIRDPERCPFDAHHLRGEALRQRTDYESALVEFRKALAVQPDDLSVLLGMAWCYKRVDRLDQAIAVTERAYRSAPEQAIVLYNLACYYALDGNKAQSLSWLGRALRMEKALRDLIADESDFDLLRSDPDFQFIAGAHEISDAT